MSDVLAELRAAIPRGEYALPEHLAIIEAVSARDPARAEEAMRAHLTSVIEALVTFAASVTSRSAL